MLSKVLYGKALLSYLQVFFYVVTADHDFAYGQLCPYSNLCQTKSLLVRHPEDERWPCCIQCSCTDSCYIYKTCCPDKVWTLANGTQYSAATISISYKNTTQIPKCQLQSDLYNDYFGQSKQYTTVDFRVINSCPETLENDSMIDAAYKCSHGTQSLKDVHFVSNVNNETLYFNKYCAECNGVYDVIHWNLKAECLGTTDSLSFKIMSEKERDNFTLSMCGISSVPPSEDIGFYFLCSLHTINTCNETGLWDFYDPLLERNCQGNQGSLYTGSDQFATTVYANIYCFLCNMKQGAFVRDLCENPFNSARTVLYPFSYLIKTTSYIQDHVKEKKVLCETNEIWDQFMLKCRQLLCPHGTIPTDGECMPLVDQLVGMTLYIYHQFNITYDMFQSLQIEYHPWFNMVRRVSGAHELESVGCLVCSIYTFKSHSERIVSETIVTSTKNCSIETMLTILHQAAKGGSFHYNWKSYNVELEIELLFENLDSQINQSFMKLKHINCRLGDVFTLDLVYCPGFRYEYSELLFFNSTNTTKNKILDQSTKINNNTYMICLKQYSDIWKKMNSSCVTIHVDLTKLILLIMYANIIWA